MKNIALRETSKNNVRSCNNCSARNYEGHFSCESKIVDELYELQVGTMCICLCRYCLEDLQNIIGNFLVEPQPRKAVIRWRT